jgi:hypothetical protein
MFTVDLDISVTQGIDDHLMVIRFFTLVERIEKKEGENERQ